MLDINSILNGKCKKTKKEFFSLSSNIKGFNNIGNILGNSKSKKRTFTKKSKSIVSSDFISSFRNYKKQSSTILGDRVTKNQRNILKSKRLISRFDDWDEDGVINGLDCQPRNKKKHNYSPDSNMMSEFCNNPTNKRNKGRCQEAANFIVSDAISKGVPSSKIEVFGVKAPNYAKPDKFHSSHVVARVEDKYYDPTKTQFGYDDKTFISDNLDHRYNKITPQPKSIFKNASLAQQQKWRDMSEQQREKKRQTKVDTDGDRTPDEYDSQDNQEEIK